MKLIVGLGNPGEKYDKTRHNLGFAVVNQFFKDFSHAQNSVWQIQNKFKSDMVEIEWQRRSLRSSGQAGSLRQALIEKVILAKPNTYMNNSGLAVSLISSFYKVPTTDIWIIHDDIDLPIGSLRIRFGGGTAGHRGVNSILEQLKTDKFWRFRLGIGHPKKLSNSNHKKAKIRRDVDEFVLEDFAHSEKGKARELIKHAAKSIAAALEDGLEAAGNRFNTK